MIQLTADPAWNLIQLNTFSSQQEDFLRGPLIGIGNDGTQTTLSLDDAKDKPAQNTVITDRHPPVGSVIVATGKVFVSGALTDCVAYTPIAVAASIASPSQNLVSAADVNAPTVRGIDLAIDSGKHVSAIKAAGLDFVARYYRNVGSRWPSLSASEAQLLSSAGLKILAVWEGKSDHVGYFSHLSGLDDSTSAYHQASVVGQPAGSAIYFAVDYDASHQDIVGAIDGYFRGVAAGFAAAGGASPDYKVGVYGSGAVCQALIQSGLAEYSWLAMSTGWAGSRTFSKWNVKQSKALGSLSFDHDSDQATGEFGGFRVSIPPA